MSQSVYPLTGWYPKRLEVNKDLMCSWFFAGDTPFTHPFFTESIGASQSMIRVSRINATSVTSPVLLPEWAQPIDAVTPSAFIFHVSRCGSTLASQMLATNPKYISLSEVPFLNDLLLNQDSLTLKYHTHADDLLRSALSFYGQKRKGDETHLFIKTDCWHIMFYDQLRRMYPDVPFIFMYRRPDEVLRSHQKQRGIQAVPGLIAPKVYGFDDDAALNTTLDGYLGLVLETFFKKMILIRGSDHLATFVDYAEGTDVILQRIAGAVGLKADDELLNGYMERARYHSKYPHQVFKQDEAVIRVPEAVEKAFGSYLKLSDQPN